QKGQGVMLPHRTLTFLWITLSLVVVVENTFGERIPSDIKQIVTSIYVQSEMSFGSCETVKLDKPNLFCVNGTGFFVGGSDAANPEQNYVYLVTTKHVLYNEETKLIHPSIVTRVNKRDGGLYLLGPIPLITDGREKTVFFHSDPTV